jgi:hypothetical protein
MEGRDAGASSRIGDGGRGAGGMIGLAAIIVIESRPARTIGAGGGVERLTGSGGGVLFRTLAAGGALDAATLVAGRGGVDLGAAARSVVFARNALGGVASFADDLGNV